MLDTSKASRECIEEVETPILVDVAGDPNPSSLSMATFTLTYTGALLPLVTLPATSNISRVNLPAASLCVIWAISLFFKCNVHRAGEVWVGIVMGTQNPRVSVTG